MMHRGEPKPKISLTRANSDKPSNDFIVNQSSNAYGISAKHRQLEQQKRKLKNNRQILDRLKAESQQLDHQLLKNHARLAKYGPKLKEMRENTGNPEYFLQFNQAMHQFAHQFILQQSAQEAGPANNTGEPDPDRMTYQQLLQLGQKVGKVSKGLSFEQLEGLRKVTFKKETAKSEDCPVCQEAFKNNQKAVELKCKHLYHEDCIVGWLKHEKVCPVCKSYVVG